MLKFFLLIFAFYANPAQACDAMSRNISSPNGNLTLSFCLADSAPHYSLLFKGQRILGWSPMGFELRGAPPLKSDFRILASSESHFNQTWEQPWGEERFIEENYRELRVDLEEEHGLQRKMTLVFRAFNDGFGFRYEIPAQKNLEEIKIDAELTEFRFLQDYDSWWIPAYADESYELLYQKSLLSRLPRYTHTPLTLSGNGIYLSIHEAALTDFSSMQLRHDGGLSLVADLAPSATGAAVETSLPMKTPWRAVQVAERPGDLITSYLFLNLNEPNRLGDVSFVRPQKFLGIWWGMHLGELTWGSGPRHGATTARAKEYIDQARLLGIPGLLIEGWNLGWDSWKTNFDFLTPHPDIDMEEVVAYGRERGVEIIGHHETAGDIENYESQLEDAFRYYARLGIRSVKTGYVSRRIHGEFHYGQRMVRHHQYVVDRAATHGISLDVHEPVKDTGLRRSYPNLMTREGARGNEYEAWGGPEGNPPSHTTILPYTRGLAGPLDFTPGIFSILDGSRPGIDRVHTTLAKQLALFVVLYSPLQMAADLPENYLGHPAFEFIRKVPVDWHKTIVLNGKIGEFITTARRDRHSDAWFIGSITDEYPRDLLIDLGFLDPLNTYCATRYRDQATADWLTNPLAIEISSDIVSQDDSILLRLAPGGGEAIMIEKCTALHN